MPKVDAERLAKIKLWPAASSSNDVRDLCDDLEEAREFAEIEKAITIAEMKAHNKTTAERNEAMDHIRHCLVCIHTAGGTSELAHAFLARMEGK